MKPVSCRKKPPNLGNLMNTTVWSSFMVHLNHWLFITNNYFAMQYWDVKMNPKKAVWLQGIKKVRIPATPWCTPPQCPDNQQHAGGGRVEACISPWGEPWELWCGSRPVEKKNERKFLECLYCKIRREILRRGCDTQICITIVKYQIKGRINTGFFEKEWRTFIPVSFRKSVYIPDVMIWIYLESFGTFF